MAAINQPTSGNQWKHDTFGCCEQPTECLLAYCCGPCYIFMAAQASGEDTVMSVLTACFPILLCWLRKKQRESRGIEGSDLNDLLCTCCCPLCTAIQFKREFTD